jgi:hypothetical protein
MTKSEYRNPKQMGMLQIHNPKQQIGGAAFVSNIRILNFVFVSKFGFRVSDLFC